MIQKDRKDEKNRRNRHLPGLAILFVCEKRKNPVYKKGTWYTKKNSLYQKEKKWISRRTDIPFRKRFFEACDRICSWMIIPGSPHCNIHSWIRAFPIRIDKFIKKNIKKDEKRDSCPCAESIDLLRLR